jgi:enoyl-CoA hydratase/carnithine racemase
MSEDLLYEANHGIGRITFNRPQVLNAFTFEMYERMAEICRQMEGDSSVRALVLTGAGGKAFASGTDISQFRTFSRPEDALEYEARMDRVLDALESCPIPTIAAIAGTCTGGGLSIAACCDLRIGAANSRLGCPIGRTLGNCLSFSNYVRLTALLGPARVKEIIFTARLVGAEEARALGLISEILPDDASLQSRADELARIVASQAPLTLRVTKEALRRIKDKMVRDEDCELLLTCYMSRDFREGVDSFLSKRKPNWTGT